MKALRKAEKRLSKLLAGGGRSRSVSRQLAKVERLREVQIRVRLRKIIKRELGANT